MFFRFNRSWGSLGLSWEGSWGFFLLHVAENWLQKASGLDFSSIFALLGLGNPLKSLKNLWFFIDFQGPELQNSSQN